MSSITNINNNTSIVNVGRTTPVTPGRQPSSKSIPVVIASDQTPIPVEEQNKVQSEVALSLLGIPRAEVALGIFADVNTYDINPSEWSKSPETYISGYGVKHIPEEAGAVVEAPRNKTTVLTSKRFFRYQPGRVSAATFGIKSTTSISSFAQNPVIRKYGIYDKYDGYYWETRQSGIDDNFSVVRRTQSLYKNPNSTYGVANELLRGADVQVSNTIQTTQLEDYRIVGISPNSTSQKSTRYLKDRKFITETKFQIIEDVWTQAMLNSTFSTYYNGLSAQDQEIFKSKCERDSDLWLDFYMIDIEYNSDAHTSFNTRNYETSLAVQNTEAPYEVILYTAMDTVVNAITEIDSSMKSELVGLITITKTFFENVDAGTVTYPTPTKFGTKSRLDTFFDTRKYYWAYYVSEFNSNGSPVVYTIPVDYPLGSDNAEKEQIIKDKCVRDTVYVIEGYRDDLIGGGNAATKYNASMYYNSNSSNNLTVFSQIIGGLPAEISRHTHLKDKILADLEDTYFVGTINTTINNKFYQNGNNTSLSNIIINNLSVEDTNIMTPGNRAVAGNLVVLRDGLVMTHAAVYDPSLLKEQEKIIAVADATNSSFTLVSNNVTFGQHVRYFGQNLTFNSNDVIVDGGLYKVKYALGQKGRTFILQDENGDTIEFDQPVSETRFQLVNPFIFPKDYDPNTYNPNNTVYLEGDPYPNGMVFPYMYTATGILPKQETDVSIGYIDTAIITDTPEGYRQLASQIDSVNFIPEYINWIKNNVNPEYYGVYEFRIPRSRFSTDQLNGNAATEENPNGGNRLVYSDVAVGPTGKVRPGQPVKTAEGGEIINNSVYDFDFTKVTMLKIEFSWYGAVGALFLAYVPIGNGEARWVRVHHLRASNQLKISSLGNATLPITYTVYGGGDDKTFGDNETGFDYGYGRDSHYVVKYGSSYYIDGGDRGTVRLYSYDNGELAGSYGRIFDLSSGTFNVADNSITTTAITDLPDNVFFMGGKVKTNNRTDQNIRVIWADSTKIYLSRTPEDTANIRIIPERSNSVFGLETKREIISNQGQKVRNRVQVYPTQLSTVNLGTTPVRMRMLKTPKFQTNVVVNGTFTMNESDGFTIDSSNSALPTASTNYIQDGESVYGWFKAVLDDIDSITIFGKLYRESSDYYFELLETYNGTVKILQGDFLADKRFNAEGIILTSSSKITEEKEGLSSVIIATDDQLPIPNTGTTIATIYLKSGTEQIKLSTYYDYNKEYLSFPLTDQADTLYFVIDSETTFNIATPQSVSDVGIGVTWEEQ